MDNYKYVSKSFIPYETVLKKHPTKDKYFQ